MDNQTPPEPSRPTPEKKGPSFGGNLIWYLLAIGLGVIFLFSLVGDSSRVEIPIGELRKLIAQGPADPEKDFDPSIEVTGGPEGRQMTVRYSNLRT